MSNGPHHSDWVSNSNHNAGGTSLTSVAEGRPLENLQEVRRPRKHCRPDVGKLSINLPRKKNEDFNHKCGAGSSQILEWLSKEREIFSTALFIGASFAKSLLIKKQNEAKKRC